MQRKKYLLWIIPSCLLLAALISILYSVKKPNRYASLPSRKVSTILPYSQISLDTVRRNEPATGTFKIYNTDTYPLRISDVYPDCTCTQYELNKKRIFPKDSAVVKVTFNYTHHDEGYFQHFVRIESNADRDFILLAIRGFLQ